MEPARIILEFDEDRSIAPSSHGALHFSKVGTSR